MAESCDIKGFGIDVEKNMIIEAKQKCPEMSIQISVSEKTPFEDNSFNVLNACMAFANKSGFLKEAARIIKRGRSLYIGDPRFPFILRKIINSILSNRNVNGKFFTPQEI